MGFGHALSFVCMFSQAFVLLFVTRWNYMLYSVPFKFSMSCAYFHTIRYSPKTLKSIMAPNLLKQYLIFGNRSYFFALVKQHYDEHLNIFL